MNTTISAKRKNDAVLTVCQNNKKNIVEIEGANRAAERLTGYRDEELKDKSINTILPSHEREMLESYLEFTPTGNDLASVLRKMPQFHILNKEGQQVPVSLKVFYVIASHPQKPQFELLMRDITLLKHLDELKEKLLKNRESEQIDPDSGLPRGEAFQGNLGLIHNFVKEYALEATFAMMQVDKMEFLSRQYGEAMTSRVNQHLSRVARSALREVDVLGYMGEGRIGMALFDCSAENAKMVMNRVRMAVENRPVNAEDIEGVGDAEIGVTVSIAFSQMIQDVSVQHMLDVCRAQVDQAHEAGGNRIYEAVVE